MSIQIPNEAVEAAAIAISGCGAAGWEDDGPHTKSMIRRDARAALEAAAPHMQALLLALADERDNVHGTIRGHITTHELRTMLGEK